MVSISISTKEKELKMLVLTARKDEPIYIGDDIVIHITPQTSTQAKVAIEAPRHVTILREAVKMRNTMGEANFKREYECNFEPEIIQTVKKDRTADIKRSLKI